MRSRNFSADGRSGRTVASGISDAIVHFAPKRALRCRNSALPRALPWPGHPPDGHPGTDAAYLFFCSLQWHRQNDPSAGWELIQGVRSPDLRTRTISASMLAATEDVHISTRELRRLSRGSQLPAIDHVRVSNPGNEVESMNTPYGLEIIESCTSCKLRKEKWFCGFSSDTLQLFSDASHLAVYPGGALLFVEGQLPRGAYLLCSGRAKLSTTSRDGKVLILRVAEAGELLGMSAVLSGEPYVITAETAGPCHVNFIEREALLRLMERNGEIGLRSAHALSREFQSMYRDVHDLVLARSSAGKLARLLLSWSPGLSPLPARAEIRIRASLTHEEMAQMIGSSRETVTRLLSDLKRKELIRFEGSMLVIRNRSALEALAA
jgi:CRP/FNR family transcriptional regulator